MKTHEHLVNFSLEYPFSFHNLDSDFYDCFVIFLAGINDMKNNSIGTRIGHLKKYCRVAWRQGYITSNEWEEFKPLDEEIAPVSYDEEDILKLYRIKKYPSKRIREAVDINTLRFYAGGLRHGDSQILSKANVINARLKNGQKVKVLSFAQNKTTAFNGVPLNEIAMEILERYKYKLPKFTDPSECNIYMKLAFKQAGYTDEVVEIRHSNKKKIQTIKPLHDIYGKSHTARYAACKMIVQAKGNIYLAKKILGHKRITTTERYMQMDDQYKYQEYIEITAGADKRAKANERKEKKLTKAK